VQWLQDKVKSLLWASLCRGVQADGSWCVSAEAAQAMFGINMLVLYASNNMRTLVISTPCGCRSCCVAGRV
jgi:hypothetical protein